MCLWCMHACMGHARADLQSRVRVPQRVHVNGGVAVEGVGLGADGGTFREAVAAQGRAAGWDGAGEARVDRGEEAEGLVDDVVEVREGLEFFAERIFGTAGEQFGL